MLIKKFLFLFIITVLACNNQIDQDIIQPEVVSNSELPNSNSVNEFIDTDLGPNDDLSPEKPVTSKKPKPIDDDNGNFQKESEVDFQDIFEDLIISEDKTKDILDVGSLPYIETPPVNSFLTLDTKNYDGEKGKVVEGCEAFTLKGKKTDSVILLLHGLAGCPYEVKNLGYYLNSKGNNIVTLRYPGHGTDSKDLSEFTWEDWFKVIEDNYLELKKTYKTVYVAGFSTGGTLSLKLSQKYKVDKVVLLSPFIFVTHKWYYGLTPEEYLKKPFTKVIEYVPTKYTLININDKEAQEDYISGAYFSLSATRTALDLIETVKEDIKLVESPMLIIHSRKDDTSDFKSSEYIFKNISSEDKTFFPLEKSNHVITVDFDKDFVYSQVDKFFD